MYAAEMYRKIFFLLATKINNVIDGSIMKLAIRNRCKLDNVRKFIVYNAVNMIIIHIKHSCPEIDLNITCTFGLL